MALEPRAGALVLLPFICYPRDQPRHQRARSLENVVRIKQEMSGCESRQKALPRKPTREVRNGHGWVTKAPDL